MAIAAGARHKMDNSGWRGSWVAWNECQDRCWSPPPTLITTTTTTTSVTNSAKQMPETHDHSTSRTFPAEVINNRSELLMRNGEWWMLKFCGFGTGRALVLLARGREKSEEPKPRWARGHRAMVSHLLQWLCSRSDQWADEAKVNTIFSQGELQMQKKQTKQRTPVKVIKYRLWNALEVWK